MDYPASKIRLINLNEPEWLLLPGLTYKNLTNWLTGAEVVDFYYENGIYKLLIVNRVVKMELLHGQIKPKR